MTQFEKKLFADVKRSIKENLSKHTVEQFHKSGVEGYYKEDAGRLWRCSRDGSSVYCFWVSAPPGWLFGYGDMGECAWSRHRDMIPFIRGSIGSFDYFAEKVSRNVSIKEPRQELAEEWLDTVLKEWKDYYGEKPSAKIKDIVDSLKEWWEDYNDPVALRMQIYESGLYGSDGESIPSFECYTYQYIWKCEALKWFIDKIDKGQVVDKSGSFDWSN